MNVLSFFFIYKFDLFIIISKWRDVFALLVVPMNTQEEHEIVWKLCIFVVEVKLCEEDDNLHKITKNTFKQRELRVN